MASAKTSEHILPLSYFGAKHNVASEVWARLGRPKNYVEPFCGRADMLVLRPIPPRDKENMTETINDVFGLVVNLHRTIRDAPFELAELLCEPLTELDVRARWRLCLDALPLLTSRLEADPDFFDLRLAHFYIYTANALVGGFKTNLTKSKPICAGGYPGRETFSGRKRGNLNNIFCRLAVRLQRVRILCGEWERALTKVVTLWADPQYKWTCGVFLDPPYENYEKLYGEVESRVSTRVREWALANGDHPRFRIALCGTYAEHAGYMPDSWECLAWTGHHEWGEKDESNTRHNECVWFSPHCHKVTK